MGVLFEDGFLDGFGTWPLAYIPYGGPDFGELAVVGSTVGNGDAAAYYAAWIAAGDRTVGAAGLANDAGHKQSARELYLRASAFYAASYHPLYGAPVDPRLIEAFKKQRQAPDRGLALNAPPVRPQAIPFEGGAMPTYFFPAAGFAGAERPTIIFTNGYDGTITDMYFALAVAASRRGCHSLLFDGPGQGAMLYEIEHTFETRLGNGGWTGRRLRANPTGGSSQKACHQRVEPRRLSCAPRGLRRTPFGRLHRRSGTMVPRRFLPRVCRQDRDPCLSGRGSRRFGRG